jgi:hypothetical protein
MQRYGVRGSLLMMMLCGAAACQSSPAAANSKQVKQALACAQSEGWFSGDVVQQPRWRVAARQAIAKNNHRLELLVYDRPDHGDYLEMEIGRDGPQRVFQLTNKAVFQFHARAIVKFPDPPRGGLWALPELVHMVQRMDKGPKLTILAAQLPAYRRDIACKGYSQSQASAMPAPHLSLLGNGSP